MCGFCVRRYGKHMNPAPKGSAPYLPTPAEEAANVLTHAVGIVLSLFALAYLVTQSTDRTHTINALVYGLSMVLLFSVSSLYHLVRLQKRWKYVDLMQRLDHGVIFIFIATSYTPWLTLLDLGENQHLGIIMLYVVWAIGLVGIAKTIFMFHSYQALELALFLGMGWSVVIVGEPIYEHMPPGCLLPIIGGGVFYSAGTIVFNMDGRLPFAHAIWHVFVLCGAFTHLCGIGYYLFS